MANTRLFMLMAAVLPLAFGQNPTSRGQGDVFNSVTTNNSCAATYNSTMQQIADDYTPKRIRLAREQANCRTNKTCIANVQARQAALVKDNERRAAAALKTLRECENTPRMDTNPPDPAPEAQNTNGKNVLKATVEQTVTPQKAMPGFYRGYADEPALPSMTGSVTYQRTRITVTTAPGRMVGQAIAGPVSFTSLPRAYSSIEGFITSPGEFTITSLKDLQSMEVLRPGETIKVQLSRRGK